MSVRTQKGSMDHARTKPPVRLELTGTIVDDISSIFSTLSYLAGVLALALAEIIIEVKNTVVRFLRRQ